MDDSLQKIEDLKLKLENLEDIDSYYLSDAIKYLRNKIMFIHARLETSIELLIIHKVNDHIKDKLTQDNIIDIRLKMNTVLEGIDYAKKANIAKQLEALPEDIFKHCMKVNNLRLVFSHPKSHDKEINELKKRENYKTALETIINAMDKMNRLFAELFPRKK